MLKINNKEYNISDEKAAELLKNYEVRKRFVPNDGGKYYFLDDEGRILDTIWDNGNVDNFRLAIGNVYATAEEAILARDRQLALVKVNNRIIELNGDWEEDWSDLSQCKFAIFYDYAYKKFISYEYTTIIENPFIKQCANSEIVSQIISELDAELKLIWGIK